MFYTHREKLEELQIQAIICISEQRVNAIRDLYKSKMYSQQNRADIPGILP